MEAPIKKQLTWGPLQAVVGSLLLFFGTQVAVGILLVLSLSILGWDTTRIESWLSDGGTMAQFLVSGVIAVVTLGLLFWYLSFVRARPADIGLVRPKIRDIGYVLFGAGIYIVAYTVLVGLLSTLLPDLNTEQLQDLGFETSAVGNELFFIFLSLVVLPPLVEEIVVRGFLFTGLRNKLSFWMSAVISSSLFGLAHLLGGEGGSTIWIAAIDTFILGMVLAYLREKTDSLWSPIGLHGLKNFIAFMALFVLKV